MKQNLFNKLWLRVGMIVAIMTTALSGTTWAADETITFSTLGLENGSQYKTINGTDCVLTFGGGGNDGKYYTTGAAIRVYGGGHMNVSSSTKTITKIELTFGTGDGSNTITTNVGTYSNGTWTGSASSITFTVGGSSGHRRIASVAVTYAGGTPTPTTYTVTYDANGGTGTMTDDDSPYTSGATVTVLDNEFTKTDYEFVGWNTAADGSGTDYDEGDTFTISANTTLYAQWKEQTSGDEQWVLTSLSDLTASDVFVIVGNNGGNSFYAMTNDKGTSGAPQAPTVTISGDKITSRVNDNFKWNLDGNEADGYSFSPNGSTENYLYCSTTASSGSNDNMRVGSGSRKLFVMDNNDHLKTKDSNTTRYVSVYTSGPNWRGYTTASTTVKFYKRIDAGAPQVPSITIFNNIEIAYDATSGSTSYTINNPVEGGTLSVPNEGNIADWISEITYHDNTLTVYCSANTSTEVRTATITLVYTYNGTETVSKDVTVTQAGAPVVYTTIPALFEAATTTSTPVNVTFGGWVVTGVNGSQVFVTDGTNGFIIYQSEHGFEVGNTLSGTASCNLVLYNGSAELTGLTSTTEGLTVGTNGSVTPIATTIDALGAVNTGSVVTLNNLTYDGSKLSDGTNEIIYYTSLFNGTTLESGSKYNVTGVFVLNNSDKRILPRSADDIEEVIIPSIIAENVNLASDATSGEIAYTITNSADGVTLVATTDADWISNIAVTADKVTFSTTANETGSARTATFTLTYTGAENKEVTVTQAAYVAPASGKYVKVTSTADLTDGQYLIVYEEGSVAFDGGLETLDASGNTIDVTISNNEIAATSATTTAEFTIDVTAGTIKSASGKYIGVNNNNNGLKQDDNASTYTNSFAIDSDGNAVIGAVFEGSIMSLRFNNASGDNNYRFRYYKNAGQKAIQLFKKVVAPTSQTVTVSSARYATFVAKANLEIPAGVEVFAVTVNNGAASAHLEPIEGGIPANEAVLVRANTGIYEFPYTTEAVAEITNNDLKASDGTITGGENIYALANKTNGVGFYPVAASVTIPAGKAYLEVTGGGVKAFYGFEEDDPTGISNLNANLNANEAIYNVAGQRLQKMQKGINIVNGKKILK